MEIKEVITVRQSPSVYGYFTVYLEKGKNRCKLATGLRELEAMKLAREKAQILKLELQAYLRRPDLDADAIRLATSNGIFS